MSGESVLTIVRLTNLERKDASMVHCNNGFPAHSLMFLFRTPFEPDLAGIIDKTLGILLRSSREFLFNCYYQLFHQL